MDFKATCGNCGSTRFAGPDTEWLDETAIKCADCGTATTVADLTNETAGRAVDQVSDEIARGLRD